MKSDERTTIGWLACIIVAFAGCATANTAAPTPVYRPSFDFEPPLDGEPGLAPEEVDVSIAIVEPEFVNPVDPELQTTAYEFSRALQGDLEEMLTSRGFTVLGPFRTYDEMVYQDKSQSELLLTPRIDVTGEVVDWQVSQETVFGVIDGGYKIDYATISLGGRVTLEFAEPFTREKLWVPSVEIARSQETFEGELRYQTPPEDAVQENNYKSALHRLLEGVYAVIMKECWDRIVPRELQTYSAQSADIREKAGYPIPFDR